MIFGWRAAEPVWRDLAPSSEIAKGFVLAYRVAENKSGGENIF
jgi:hypothetical protein